MHAAIRPPLPLQIRAGDCDTFGHINNAVYVAFVQQALAEALARAGHVADWQHGGQHTWELRSLMGEYRQAARFGDDLAARLWLLRPVAHLSPGHAGEERLAVGCEIVRTGRKDKQTVFRSESTWERVERASGALAIVPEGLDAAFSTESGTPLRAFAQPNDDPKARRYVWQHVVMRGEVDPADRAHPQSVYRWLEEAVFDASAQGGWPVERWLAAGAFTLQTRHDTRVQVLPRRGERLAVISTLVDVRRLRGTWLQEMRRIPDGALLLRNYSTGVFLDLDGRPTAAPPQAIADVRYISPSLTS